MDVTLDRQIDSFKKTVENNLPKVFNKQTDLKQHLSESLFIVSTSVNDFFKNGTFRGTADFSSKLLKEFSPRLLVYVALVFTFHSMN